jgi:hypothetical protein
LYCNIKKRGMQAEPCNQAVQEGPRGTQCCQCQLQLPFALKFSTLHPNITHKSQPHTPSESSKGVADHHCSTAGFRVWAHQVHYTAVSSLGVPA